MSLRCFLCVCGFSAYMWHWVGFSPIFATQFSHCSYSVCYFLCRLFSSAWRNKWQITAFVCRKTLNWRKLHVWDRMANKFLDFRMHGRTLSLFLVHALYNTFFNTKYVSFSKAFRRPKGYELITNIILPEDFQASVWAEINLECIFFKDK